MDFYPWIVLIHVVAILIFILGHGVSSFVMFRVRAEPDRARLAALLDLSASSLVIAGIALLVSLVAGIVAGIMGGWWGQLWIWASLVLLIAVGGLMTPMAGIPMNQVREALGLRGSMAKKDAPAPEPKSDDELAAAQAALRPELVAVLGVGAIVVITWLMEAKPF